MGADWGFLSMLMDNAQAHVTGIGKVWMTVFFLFRIMVLCGPAESVWSDDPSSFFCDTIYTGCTHFCYNYFYPISHIRFWTMQFIFVATPTLMYLGHVMHVTHKENKLREQLANTAPTGGTREFKQPRYTDERGHVKIHGSLLCTYLIQLVVKILIEAASIWGQYYLYEFKVPFQYACNAEDARHNVCRKHMTTCHMHRPAEKTIFVIFMLAVACFSVLLNVLDVLYVLCRCCKRRCNHRVKRTAVENQDSLPVYNDVIMEVEGLQGGSLSGSLDGGHRGGWLHQSPPLSNVNITENTQNPLFY